METRETFGFRNHFKETKIAIQCKDFQLNLHYTDPKTNIKIVISNFANPDIIITCESAFKEFGITEIELESIADKIVAKCIISPHEFISLFIKRKFIHFVQGVLVEDASGMNFWVDSKFNTANKGSFVETNIGLLNLIFKRI